MGDDFYYNKSEKVEMAKKLAGLKPDLAKAAQDFFKKSFEAGELSKKVKELIALACAHMSQCAYCIDSHTLAAKEAGASQEEIAEAIFVAASMKAGGVLAHARIAMKTLEE